MCTATNLLCHCYRCCTVSEADIHPLGTLDAMNLAELAFAEVSKGILVNGFLKSYM